MLGVLCPKTLEIKGNKPICIAERGEATHGDCVHLGDPERSGYAVCGCQQIARWTKDRLRVTCKHCLQTHKAIMLLRLEYLVAQMELQDRRRFMAARAKYKVSLQGDLFAAAQWVPLEFVEEARRLVSESPMLMSGDSADERRQHHG